MSDKTLIGISTNGVNEIIELKGADLETFNAERNTFHNAVEQADLDKKEKQEAAKAKFIALGLTESELIALGILPKPKEQSGTL